MISKAIISMMKKTAGGGGGSNVSTTGLISEWKLDEASGNALDAFGSNTLTAHAAPGATTGKVNGARTFTAASSQYFDIADNASLSVGDIDFTVIAWVNLTSKVDQTFIYKGTGSLSEYELYYDSASDRFHFYVENGGTHGDVQATVFGSPSLATWYYIVAWHDSVGNTINIQVNDGTANSQAYSAGAADTAGAFSIGSEGGTLFSNAKIDEVSFWKKVLSSGDKTTLANGGAGLPIMI